MSLDPHSDEGELALGKEGMPFLSPISQIFTETITISCQIQPDWPANSVPVVN